MFFSTFAININKILFLKNDFLNQHNFIHLNQFLAFSVMLFKKKTFHLKFLFWL